MSVFKRLLSKEKEDKAAKEPEVEVMKDYQEFNPFTELLFLQGHSDIVRLLLRIDANRCVSAADDNLAIIWNVQLGYKLVVLSGHSRPITDMAVLPAKGDYSQQLLTGSSDKQIRGAAVVHVNKRANSSVVEYVTGSYSSHIVPKEVLVAHLADDYIIKSSPRKVDADILFVTKIWNVDTGDCVKVLTDHSASVRCLLVLGSGCQFCSGGQGLFLWYRDGHLATSQQTGGEENDICFMISLRNDRIVTAVDKQLIVYTITKSEMSLKSSESTEPHKDRSGESHIDLVKKLSPHREAVRSLINITDSTFASGSIDGTVILWKTDNLLPFRYFNSIPEYQGPDKTFPYSVQYMACVESRYIIAAVGSGFCLYDTETGRALIHKINAHFSKVSSIMFVCGGLFLATASTDGSIRLWGYRNVLRIATTSDSLNGKGLMHTFSGRPMEELNDVTHKQLEPQLLGECLAHSGAVQSMIDCDGESLISSGVDHLVIVWRNQTIQMMKRSHVLQTQMSVDGIV